MAAPEPPPPGISEEVWCKNRLQQYTQRASLPLPVYQTYNEGTPHAPQFRSRVWVDEMCFTSPNTFSNRKMSEQDAAKYALVGIREKVKDEGSSRILEDTIFCKSIINEYAVKMNLEPPVYVTNESKAMLPIFQSSLALDGVTFVGAAGKNKKEAEQFAARSAILSILESESSTVMSEIVKSKFKFYDALKMVKDSSSTQCGTIPTGVETFKGSSNAEHGNAAAGMIPLANNNGATFSGNKGKEIHSSSVQGAIVHDRVNQLEDSAATFSLNKEKEVPVSVIRGIITSFFSPNPQPSLSVTLPAFEAKPQESSLEQLSKSQTSSAAIAPQIVLVPPASEQALICSTSGEKRNRKKKAKKEVQCLNSTVQPGYVPDDNGATFAVNKEKEVNVSGGIITGPFPQNPHHSLSAPLPAFQASCPESSSKQLSDTRATYQPLHLFKKPEQQTSSEVIAPPIVFVPPASEQALMLSASGKKRNRKKKKAKKNAQYQSPSAVVTLPQTPAPVSSVAN